MAGKKPLKVSKSKELLSYRPTSSCAFNPEKVCYDAKISQKSGKSGKKQKQGATFSVAPCFLSGREDSNFRPLAPHASTLANCATPRITPEKPGAGFSSGKSTKNLNYPIKF